MIDLIKTLFNEHNFILLLFSDFIRKVLLIPSRSIWRCNLLEFQKVVVPCCFGCWGYRNIFKPFERYCTVVWVAATTTTRTNCLNSNTFWFFCKGFRETSIKIKSHLSVSNKQQGSLPLLFFVCLSGHVFQLCACTFRVVMDFYLFYGILFELTKLSGFDRWVNNFLVELYWSWEYCVSRFGSTSINHAKRTNKTVLKSLFKVVLRSLKSVFSI